VKFDETSYSINGDTGWACVATTGQNYITIEASRGAYVLQKHFGTFCGVAISDGWYAYKIFEMLQRCWAHILQEARHLSRRTKLEDAAQLYDSLQELFSDAKSGLEDIPASNYLLHQEMMKRLEEIISVHETYMQLRKFITKLKNAKDNLFTFLLYPGVLPTNNAAKQALREPIVHRKIRRLVRNEKGMKMFGNLMTCMMTWNLRECNIIHVVKHL